VNTAEGLPFVGDELTLAYVELLVYTAGGLLVVGVEVTLATVVPVNFFGGLLVFGFGVILSTVVPPVGAGRGLLAVSVVKSAGRVTPCSAAHFRGSKPYLLSALGSEVKARRHYVWATFPIYKTERPASTTP
jgi:hypothetical protein